MDSTAQPGFKSDIFLGFDTMQRKSQFRSWERRASARHRSLWSTGRLSNNSGTGIRIPQNADQTVGVPRGTTITTAFLRVTAPLRDSALIISQTCPGSL
jgi:hypothetical protein